MEHLSLLHQIAAIYSFAVGAVVLRNRKGTVLHTWLGRSFVAAMILTDLSAFGLVLKYGWSWFHLLASWNFVYILLGLWCALRRPSASWIVQHFYYFSYAYLGVIAAAVARVPLIFVEDIAASALIAMAVVFGVGAFLIERLGKQLRAQQAVLAQRSAV